MTILKKAQSAADFLALLPQLLGQDPRNSVVLVTFRAQITTACLRFDLPRGSGAESRTVQKRLATALTGYLCKIRDVDSAVIVILTDDRFGETSTPPHADLVGALKAKIAQAGFHLGDVLCLASDGWGSYFNDDVPAGGHPLTEIAESEAARVTPVGVCARLDARDLPPRVPDADEHTRERMREELENIQLLIDELKPDELKPDEDRPWEIEPLGDLPWMIEQALTWSDERVERDGPLLLFAIQGPPMRDMTMLQWASDLTTGEQIWEESVQFAAGHLPIGEETADLILGNGPRPDPDRIERGIELLLTLVASAEDRYRPAPLCMLAWLHWALGRSSCAGVYVGEARTIDPSYGMGELLDTMLCNGMLPEWAFGDLDRLDQGVGLYQRRKATPSFAIPSSPRPGSARAT